LFSDIGFSITRGDKIALVAKNGSGKTTLLKMLNGEEAPEGETAKIRWAKGITISFLKQEPDLADDSTALESVLDSDNPSVVAIKEYEEALLSQDDQLIEKCVSRLDDLKAWDIENRIKEILSKLNIVNLNQRIGTMSGGQKKRVALARILIEEPDFLILDEPTNHLDLDMIEWLEGYLEKSKLTLFMVNHDRYFLEVVCNEII